MLGNRVLFFPSKLPSAAHISERHLEPVSVLEGALVRLRRKGRPHTLHRVAACKELGSHMELIINVRRLGNSRPAQLQLSCGRRWLGCGSQCKPACPSLCHAMRQLGAPVRAAVELMVEIRGARICLCTAFSSNRLTVEDGPLHCNRTPKLINTWRMSLLPERPAVPTFAQIYAF